MRRKRLLKLMGEINEDYIEEAAADMLKKKRPIWRYWAAAAACITLVFTAAVPIIRSLTQAPHKNTADFVQLVKYNDAYYEVVENNPQFLERRGIETEITKETAGKHITYLRKEYEAGGSDYIVSEEETNFELLEYAPAKQEAVRVLRDGDDYFAVTLCNYLIPDAESLPFDEIFKVYGITKAEDIKSIVSVKTDNEYEANGSAVTDPVLIASFYKKILSLEKYSENEFRKMQSTDEADGNSGRFADDRKDFMVETMDGLKFIVSYFPTFDWVSGSQTQTYYRLSPALEAWIETNLTP